jgi:DNA topoisomerase III
VLEICRHAKQSIAVKRARFSALVPSEIKKAINRTVAPNKKEADAVEARSILDLRSGAAFTRFQTLLLQDRFNWQQHGVFQTDKAGNVRDKLLVSFGSCQYPTLGLIVKRHWCVAILPYVGLLLVGGCCLALRWTCCLESCER